MRRMQLVGGVWWVLGGGGGERRGFCGMHATQHGVEWQIMGSQEPRAGGELTVCVCGRYSGFAGRWLAPARQRLGGACVAHTWNVRPKDKPAHPRHPVPNPRPPGPADLGLDANLAGKPARQLGQVFLPWACHLLKHARQKLCWQGACTRACVRVRACGVWEGEGRWEHHHGRPRCASSSPVMH